MLDSTGRRLTRANGTVFDLFPVGQTILVLGALLVLLFTLIRPEASNGLGTWPRFVFWILHVGLGLAALRVSSLWLANGNRLPDGTFPAVLATGCAGALLAAPGYLMLDALYEPYIADTDPEPAVSSLLLSLIGEFLDLAPWFLTSWLLLNLPVLLPLTEPASRTDDRVHHVGENKSAEKGGTKSELNLSPDENLQVADLDSATDISNNNETQKLSRQQILASLPGIIGTDVIAVASDLHYLNVWTVAGRTTILGNLREVVKELGARGMQVHRSHWVAHSHVRRITGNSNNGACILSNELRVPISRRRWKMVTEQYGRGVVHTDVNSDL